MPPDQQFQDEFLKDLQQNQSEDILTKPLVETPSPAQEPAADEEEARTRRERRLKAKLQAERESAIALAARLDALTQAQKAAQTSETEDYLRLAEQIYGNTTPETAAATDLLKKALSGAEERAYARALQAFEERQQAEDQEIAQAEKSLDQMIDDIEETYNVSIDESTQHAFYQLLERLSPKRNGEIVEYADPFAVWEELQSRRQQTTSTRAKDLAARSMARTGAQTNSNLEEDANARWLRDNGII